MTARAHSSASVARIPVGFGSSTPVRSTFVVLSGHGYLGTGFLFWQRGGKLMEDTWRYGV